MNIKLPMQFLLDQAALTQRLLRKVDSQLSVHGISFTEYLIMYHLANAPQSTLRRIELAEAVGISASGVTRLLAPMEKLHLVAKQSNPRDARVSLVKLSKTGSRLFAESSTSLEHLSGQLCSAVSVPELRTLLALSARIAA